jgi:tetratricopeptide (TPR) repeat protein
MDEHITIGVPAYNCERFIEATIQSIIDQSYPHFQCIISLDKSVDGSESAILRAVEGDARFVLRRHEERLGWVGNTNRLLSDMQTGLFALMPHDDRVSPNYIEETLAQLRRWPDAVAVSGLIGSEDQSGLRKNDVAALQMTGSLYERLRAYLSGPVHALPYRALVRRERILGPLQMPELPNEGRGSDRLWTVKLAMSGEVRVAPHARIVKAHHPESVTAKWSAWSGRQLADTDARLAREILSLLDDCPFAANERAELSALVLVQLAGDYMLAPTRYGRSDRSTRDLIRHMAALAIAGRASIHPEGLSDVLARSDALNRRIDRDMDADLRGRLQDRQVGLVSDLIENPLMEANDVANLQLALAQEEVTRGETARALAYANAALRFSPHDPAIVFQISDLFKSCGDPVRALSILDGVEGSVDSHVLHKVGQRRQALGDYTGALRVGEQVARDQPDDWRYRMRAAALHLSYGDASQAKRHCDAALDKRSDLAEAWHVKSIAFEREGRLNDALETARRAYAESDGDSRYRSHMERLTELVQQ